MPTRPPVAGATKHQMHFAGVPLGGEAVLTFWMTRPEASASDARIEQERDVLEGQWGLAGGVAWRTLTASGTYLWKIKSWRFDTSPPQKPASGDRVDLSPLFATGGGALPGQVAVAVSLRSQPVGTYLRGRNGRMYFPTPRTSGADASGFILTTEANTWRTVVANIRAAINATGSTWCFYGTQQAGVPAPALIPIDHVLLHQAYAVVRSRRPDQAAFPRGS